MGLADLEDEPDVPMTNIENTVIVEKVDITDLGEAEKPTFSDTYAAKKTVAQGMMDIALLTANANQLRYLIEYNRYSTLFELNITLIVISILIQIAVGVLLIFKGRYDLSDEDKRLETNRINNYVVVGIFIVTVLNVFVAALSVPASSYDSSPHPHPHPYPYPVFKQPQIDKI